MPPEFGPPRPPSSSSAAPQANRDANAAAFAAAREYAFAHGLARDHLAIDPFEIAHRNMQRTSELIDNKAWLAQDFGKLFDDGSEGASRIFRDILHQMREVMQQKVDKQAKLKVPKGSLLLLQQASELWEYCQSEKVVADARAEIREMLKTAHGEEKEGLEQALRDIDELECIKQEKKRTQAMKGDRQSSPIARSGDDGQMRDLKMTDAPTGTSSTLRGSRENEKMELDAPHTQIVSSVFQRKQSQLPPKHLNVLDSTTIMASQPREKPSTASDGFDRTSRGEHCAPRKAQRAGAVPTSRRTLDIGKSQNLGDHSKDHTIELDQIFDHEFSLDGFVSMRRGDMPAPKAVPGSRPSSTANCPGKLPKIVEEDYNMSEAPPPEPRPIPWDPILQTSPPSSSRQFVISTSLFTLQSLMRRLEALDPFARFIERDFAQHASSPASAALSHEADIILSPSTGLVLTTLSHLRQMALPGSSVLPPLRARLLNVAPRYARLIVLVACGQPEGVTTPTPADAETLACLQGFLRSAAFAKLGTSVQVVLALSGQEEVARWTVLLMAQHGKDLGLNASDSEAEETPWELWLRRAGLNALAAMAVLAPPKHLAERDDQNRGEDAAAAKFRHFVRVHESGPSAFEQRVGRTNMTQLASTLDRNLS